MKKRTFFWIGLVIWTLGAFLIRPGLAASYNDQGALDIVVNEVAWMGTTASYNDEWIELYNNTASPVDLSGWTLNAGDGTPSISLTGTIPAGGYYLLERGDDAIPALSADQIYTGALGNDGEDLVLRDDLSALVDQVDCSGGWFSGQADDRVPMVRVDPTASGSDSENWTYNPRCGTPTNAAGESHACTLAVVDVGTDLALNVYFNERFEEGATTSELTNMEKALLEQIEGALSSIDIALYGLDRQSVVDALIAAHTRGVTVRVVGDDEAENGSYSSSYQALKDAGITVVTDSSPSYIQHNKFLIIDDQAVWTGSANFTDTGFSLNANNSMFIDDATLAAVYQAEFAEMWSGNFHGDKTDNTTHLLNYNGTLLESYFSPTDLTLFEVWEELAQADESVHFAMFMWTNDILTDRVIERLNAGVAVSGVWDQLGASNPYSADGALASAGADIFIENQAGKTHHKFAVIDVESSDPAVILGSYNWTDSGSFDNDENTLIIHDRYLARVYYQEWKRLRYGTHTWADFDGDGNLDVSVFRPSNGRWYVMGQASVPWAVTGDLPVPGDYDGDGAADIAVYRPSNGGWYIKDQGRTTWGYPDDIPVQADYDGDGTTDLAVLRPSNGRWYIQGLGATSWFMSGDIPVPCDYDGDGAAEIAVFRPSNNTWYVQGESPVSWAQSGDLPVPADYDGDGYCDIAVYRPSNGNWYVQGQGLTSWGRGDDIPVPGDYNGDGRAEIAVLRPSNGRWYIQGLGNLKWFRSGDVPVPARDTNADGDPYQ